MFASIFRHAESWLGCGRREPELSPLDRARIARDAAAVRWMDAVGRGDTRDQRYTWKALRDATSECLRLGA